MGAVTIETYNVRLMNVADYADEVQLKNLLRHYNGLQALAIVGDTVAAAIYLDLKTALESRCLTAMQQHCLEGHLVDRAPTRELAAECGRSESTVRESIKSGLVRLQRALLDGSLYREVNVRVTPRPGAHGG